LAPKLSHKTGPFIPFENQLEPKAILLGTGGVEDSTAPETLFRTRGVDPTGQKHLIATLTPFLQEPGQGEWNSPSFVAPGGPGFSGCLWGMKAGKLAEALAKSSGNSAFCTEIQTLPDAETLDDFFCFG